MVNKHAFASSALLSNVISTCLLGYILDAMRFVFVWLPRNWSSPQAPIRPTDDFDTKFQRLLKFVRASVCLHSLI